MLYSIYFSAGAGLGQRMSWWLISDGDIIHRGLLSKDTDEENLRHSGSGGSGNTASIGNIEGSLQR